MKRGFTVFYSTLLLLLTLAGMMSVFYFAVQAGVWQAVLAIVGVLLGVALAPVLHELGHVLFAVKNGMTIVLVKCFCFRFQKSEGEKRITLASPFAPDETQVVPRFGGNMKKRAGRYTLGGLIFGGIFCVILLVLALVLKEFKLSYLFLGMLPYAAYLFLLNAAPLCFPSGKTDARVYLGLKKGCGEEKAFLSAMEIQGELSEGKSFLEIEESLYFDFPQLPEDEPLFAVTLDLRYRLYLEKNELKNAADCLNRLASAQAYFSPLEEQKLAAELVYMHSLNGDYENAEACGKVCKEFLKSNSIVAKRALAGYSLAFGELELAEILIKEGYQTLENEEISGYAKAERILLSRLEQGIKEGKNGNKE